MIGPIDNQSVYRMNSPINNLNNMNFKNIPAQDKDEKLKEAAKDFEAVFIHQFMETIDKTVERSDFLRGGNSENTFRSMLNQEIAKNTASSPSTSFGIAEQIYRQMKDRI